MLMENEEVYLQTKPLVDRIERYARISWNSLTSYVRDEKVKYITFQDVKTEEYPVGITISQNDQYQRMLTLE